MNLDDLFPLSFYTNMSYRPDRAAYAIQEIAKVGLVPQRLEGVVYRGATNTKDRYLGCGLTHLKGLKIARELNQNVLMFEDDVLFINNYSDVISKALDELPENWDMLYLGANICGTLYQTSETLGKLTHAQATHAYGVNKNFLPKLLEMEPRLYEEVIDLIYGFEIVPNNNCFIMVPMVAVQKEDFSDIEQSHRNFNWMEERFYNNLIRR